MNEKSTEKKRTEAKTLKRIYKILMKLRKLDEHWEGAIYSSEELHTSTGSFDKENLIGNALSLLKFVEYDIWSACNVGEYGLELMKLLRKLGYNETPIEWDWYYEDYAEEHRGL